MKVVQQQHTSTKDKGNNMATFFVCEEVDKEDPDRLVLCYTEQGRPIETIIAKDWDYARSKIPDGKYKHVQGHGFYNER